MIIFTLEVLSKICFHFGFTYFLIFFTLETRMNKMDDNNIHKVNNNRPYNYCCLMLNFDHIS